MLAFLQTLSSKCNQKCSRLLPSTVRGFCIPCIVEL